jgi:hypothetical protein
VFPTNIRIDQEEKKSDGIRYSKAKVEALIVTVPLVNDKK